MTVRDPGYYYSLKSTNQIAKPGVKLKLHNDGVIQRHLFNDEKMEDLLFWRIYKYNDLIYKESAANQEIFSMDFGTGTFRAMIVIEGPFGSMPVSNIIEFPLFPSKEQGFECLPIDSDHNELPDFIEPVVEKRAQRIVVSKAEIQLLRIWNAWKYRIFEAWKDQNMYEYDLIDNMPVYSPLLDVPGS